MMLMKMIYRIKDECSVRKERSAEVKGKGEGGLKLWHARCKVSGCEEGRRVMLRVRAEISGVENGRGDRSIGGEPLEGFASVLAGIQHD